MITQLTFDETINYKDDASGIALPVTLKHSGRIVRTSAKVDTGAEVCLFSHEDGLKLGLSVEQGIPIVLDSLGGNVPAFGHEITIQTGDLTFQSVVYFAKYPNLPRNILGRQGWLRNLRLAVIDYDNLLFLSAYDS